MIGRHEGKGMFFVTYRFAANPTAVLILPVISLYFNKHAFDVKSKPARIRLALKSKSRSTIYQTGTHCKQLTT